MNFHNISGKDFLFTFRAEFVHVLDFPHVLIFHSNLPCPLSSVSPMFTFQGPLFCSRELIRSGFGTERPVYWKKYMSISVDKTRTQMFLRTTKLTIQEGLQDYKHNFLFAIPNILKYLKSYLLLLHNWVPIYMTTESKFNYVMNL